MRETTAAPVFSPPERECKLTQVRNENRARRAPENAREILRRRIVGVHVRLGRFRETVGISANQRESARIST